MKPRPTTRLLLLLIAGLAAAAPACRRRRDQDRARGPSPEVAERAIRAENLPISCDDRPLAVDAAKLRRLLPPGPGLPQPFFQASVSLGQPTTYLDRRLPREAFTAWEPPFHPGMCIGLDTIFVGSTDSAVNYVTAAFVRLPRAEARALVAASWGEPTVTKTPDGTPIVVWFDPLTGYQARLLEAAEDDVSVLHITRYLTLEDLLGDTSPSFGFALAVQPGDPIAETMKLISEDERPRPAQLAPGETDGTIWLTLPPLELRDDDTTAQITFQNGVVTSVSVLLPKDDDVRGRAGYIVSKKGRRFVIDDDASPGQFFVILSGEPTAREGGDPEAVRAQCERVIDAFWRGARPALPLLKLDGRAGLEKEYKTSYTANRLREDCPRLTAWTRDCLEKAPNALTAIKSCGADPFYFRPVDLVKFSDIVPHPKLDAAAQQRRLAELTGRWVDDQGFTSLTFDAGGHVDTSFTLYGGKRFRVDLDWAGALALYDGDKFADTLSYVLDGADTLRLCVNSTYRHGPRIGTEERWIARFSGEILYYEQGRCTTVGESGEILPSPCSVETDPDGRRTLKLSIPNPYWPTVDASWLLLPGWFVDPDCPVLRRKN